VDDDNLSLVDAIRLAKEAEQKAASLYRAAAGEATNPLVRRLFEQLAEFEVVHYEKLLELERSLREQGTFIDYEGKELSAPAEGGVARIEGAQKTSAAKVLNQSMHYETEAEKRYTALAKRTTDPRGKSMFERLAEEEHQHYLVLQSVYYDVMNLKPVG
jgi:rubrerythrin